MSRYVIGLDVSTSVTGYCIIDLDCSSDQGSNIKRLGYIDFKKCNNLFEKADKVASVFGQLVVEFPEIELLGIEEPLLGFQKGMSSASTITTLMKFNGIVSYVARATFKVDPTYVSAAHARKLCGVKVQRTAIAKMSGKEQVFRHMTEHDLKHIVWELKKNGQQIDASRDMTDAYVIAKAVVIQHEQDTKKHC